MDRAQLLRKSYISALNAGLGLLILLPLGLSSINSVFFKAVWAFSMFGQLLATLLALVFLWKHLPKVVLAIGALFLLVIAAQSNLPITEKDALIYHLAVPKLWIQHGQIYQIPWHDWSYYPMLLGLGYSGFLQLGLDKLCAIFHLSYLILITAVIYDFTLRRLGNFYGIVAFLLTLSLPLFIKLGGVPLADLGLGFYFVLGFCLINEYASSRSREQLIGAGLAFGLALGSRYNGLLAFAIFLLFLPAFLGRLGFSRPEILKVFLTLCILATTLFLPWALRNYLWTGNPLEPFMGKVFNSSSSNVAFMGVSPLTHRASIYRENWLQIISLPVRIFLVGKDDKAQFFDGVLSPILLLSFLVALAKSRTAWESFILKFSLTYIIFSLLLFHALVRYQTPALCLLVPLTAAGLIRLSQGRIVIPLILVSLQVAFGFSYLISRLDNLNFWEYLQGALNEEAYLEKRVPEFKAAKFINSNLPAESSTYLLLTGNPYFLFDRPVIGAYFSAAPLLLALQQETPSAESIKREFLPLADHLLFHKARVRGLLDTGEKTRAWDEFMGSARSLYEDQLYLLVALPNSSGLPPEVTR